MIQSYSASMSAPPVFASGLYTQLGFTNLSLCNSNSHAASSISYASGVCIPVSSTSSMFLYCYYNYYCSMYKYTASSNCVGSSTYNTIYPESCKSNLPASKPFPIDNGALYVSIHIGSSTSSSSSSEPRHYFDFVYGGYGTFNYAPDSAMLTLNQSNFELDGRLLADIQGALSYEFKDGGKLGSINTAVRDVLNGVTQFSEQCDLAWSFSNQSTGYLRTTTSIHRLNEDLWDGRFNMNYSNPEHLINTNAYNFEGYARNNKSMAVGSPTFSPTVVPTSFPTLYAGSGYITSTMYAGSACLGKAYAQQSIEEGECLISYNTTTGKAIGSKIVTAVTIIGETSFQLKTMAYTDSLCSVSPTGPSTTSPSRYIRFIFNRVILENAVVRAAAVATLGAFATRVPELRPSIVVLLRRSLVDEDDEVRDRAAILLKSFDSSIDEAELRFLLDESLPMTFTALERSVKAYLAHPMVEGGSAHRHLTFSSLPIIEDAFVPTGLPAVRAGAKKKSAASAGGGGGGGGVSSGDGATESVDPAASVYRIPELAGLGRAFRSSAEVALTETEVEYVVTCVKHIFENHVVLQFTVLNTIDEQRLKDVKVNIEVGDPDLYEIDKVIPASVAKYGEHSSCFVAIRRLGDPSPTILSCQLHFKVVQINPTTGEVEGSDKGFDEEYPLEDVELSTNDFMAKRSLGDFRRTWEQIGSDGEVLEKFALQFKKLEDAVLAVTDFLGMQPADGTGAIPAGDGSKRTHTLHLSGVFVGNVPVLVRAQLQMDEASGVVLKIAVRSQNKEVSQLVCNCIR